MEEQSQYFTVHIPQKGPMAGIANWKHYYFLGITRGELDSINLNYQQISGLLNMIGVNSFIATGLAVDPIYAINWIQETIATPWLNMYAVLAHYQSDIINVAYQEKKPLFLTEEWSRGLFSKNSGWPESLTKKHDYRLNGYQMFILPFLVPDHTELVDLTQSMKTPDGSIELFWFSYFDTTNPERLLSDLVSLKSFILEQRQELIIQ